jgi:hypothetical protein
MLLPVWCRTAPDKHRGAPVTRNTLQPVCFWCPAPGPTRPTRSCLFFFLLTAQPLLKSGNTRCIMQAHSATWKTTRDGGKQRCTPQAQKQCWLGDDSEGSFLTKNAQQCYGRLSDLEDEFADDRALEEYRWGRACGGSRGCLAAAACPAPATLARGREPGGQALHQHAARQPSKQLHSMQSHTRTHTHAHTRTHTHTHAHTRTHTTSLHRDRHKRMAELLSSAHALHAACRALTRSACASARDTLPLSAPGHELLDGQQLVCLLDAARGRARACADVCCNALQHPGGRGSGNVVHVCMRMRTRMCAVCM